MSEQFKGLVHKALPTSSLPAADIKRMRIEMMGGKQARFDYASDVEEIARQARTPSEQSTATGLVESRTKPRLEIVLSTALSGIETPTARRLREARQKINNREFAAASKVLQEILTEQPTHPEAHLMLAECEFGLGSHLPALQRLHRVSANNPKPELRTRIGELCLRISDELWPSLFEKCVQMSVEGQSAQAISQVQQMIGLSPASAMFYYLLAMLQMMSSEIAAAGKSIESASVFQRPHEAAKIRQLRNDINERAAQQKIVGAVELFKQKKYRPAREFLASLEADVRCTNLWMIFDSFLKECEKGRPHQPAAENLKDAERLYELILAKEVTALRAASSSAEAERIAAQAVGFLPQYPFAHFLLARSGYERTLDQIFSGSPPELDEMVSYLQRMSTHAMQATVDNEITAAPDLKEAIDQLVTIFVEAQKQFEEQRREARIVNPIIEEFIKIMEGAQDGISSTAQLHQAANGLQSIQKKIPAALPALKSDSAIEVMQGLEEAVTANLKTLAELEDVVKDRELLHEIFEPFNKLMKQLNASGRAKPTAIEINHAREVLSGLQQKVPRVRGKLKTQTCRDELAEFENALAAAGII